MDVKDIKQYNNENEFKKESILLLLNQLVQKNLITSNEDKELLSKYYNDDKRSLFVIFDEIKALKKDEIDKLLIKLKNVKEDNKISLDNITDFTNEKTGKKYIAIRYQSIDGKISVKVVENRSGMSAKELFEKYKDEDGLVNVEGFVKSSEVYQDYIEPNRIEVKMHNVTELARRGEFKKLTTDQKKRVIALVQTIVNEMAGISDKKREKLRQTKVEDLIKMFNKEVFISPEENIVMICVPSNPKEDKVMTVTQDINGEYKLTSLNAKGYEYVNDGENAEKEQQNAPSQPTEKTDKNEAYEKEKETLGENKGKPKRILPPWQRRNAA